MPTKSGKKTKIEKEFPLEDYREDIEEDFEGAGEELEEESVMESPSGNSQELEAETEDSEDHDEELSDQEAPGGEFEAESSEFGEEPAPAETDSELELEPLEGDFDETLLEMGMEDVPGQQDEDNLLDAWYAEFADPVSTALARQQKELNKLNMEVVIGKDDRVQIKNTKAYPWRVICSLLITARDGSRWIGTGWLVGKRTVITAGHCVYMHSRGGWARHIEVIPGRNGAQKPYGSCFAYSFRSVKGWTKKKKRSHDYGAIILPSSCSFGKKLGYFGYANLSIFNLLGRKMNLSGYPGDKPKGTQWWHCRRIRFVTARTLVYNIDTAGGQSGAPVWRLRSGKRHVVGIHTNGSLSGNSATRITKPVFKNIKKWKYL